MRKSFLSPLILLSLTGIGVAEDRLTFERDIRPVFKTHCFHCHGEDGRLEGGLDLRLRRLAAEGGDSGAAIVPGQGRGSLLIARLRQGEMPPDDRPKLSPEEIDRLERWIDQGAATAREEPATPQSEDWTLEERSFWSFLPPTRPTPPLPLDTGTARRQATLVDAFVLEKLQARGWSYSAEAERAVLARRLSFDLLGLPPSPEQVRAYVEDSRPDSHERFVDRLLASPRFGERWGRHWLDVAGYADSEGYREADAERPWAYFYRDYVIRALNANKPFDQFVVEQLAGDELAGDKLPGDRAADPSQGFSDEQIERLTATGFLRMAPDGTSGGADLEVARNDVMAATLEIVSTSLLGLTVGCARCHNHRYDPISHVDYHRLRAVFEPAYNWRAWRTPEQRRLSLYTAADRAAAAKINAEAAEVDRERAAEAQKYIARTLEEELATLPEAIRQPLREAYQRPAAERSAEQKKLLKDHPSVANISVGSLYLYDRRREERAGQLDRQRKTLEAELVAETRAAALAATLAAAPPELRGEAERVAGTPSDARTDAQRDLLRQHPGLLATAATLERDNPPAAQRLQALAAEAAQLRAEKAADNLKRYDERASQIRARIPLERFLRALTEVPGQVPATRLFYRGDHAQPKQPVAPGELSVLSDGTFAIPENDSARPTTGRRLAYARHLTDGRHPLLARVTVNRIWKQYFGRGIVDTPGDFGLLGDRPTHPELLDFLADELIRSGWSLKHVHRLIVCSSAYRQASHPTDHEDADPENRLLGRMALRRLDAECVRDTFMSLSERLNGEMFGPPAPVMEDEVGQIVIGKENLDGERKPGAAIPLHGAEFRRSLYVQVRRSRPLGVLETFDAPQMTPNCVSRDSSNVAQQALLMMNSPLAAVTADQIAARALAARPTLPEQLAEIWQWIYARPPRPEQLAAAEQFVQRQTLALGPDNATNKGDLSMRAALASYCQALLSSNQFLYIE